MLTERFQAFGDDSYCHFTMEHLFLYRAAKKNPLLFKWEKHWFMHQFIPLSLQQVLNVQELNCLLVFDENQSPIVTFPFIQEIYSRSKGFPLGKSGGGILF